MRLFLSLPALGLVLFMALQGPAPAQAASDFTSTLEGFPAKLKEFGSALENKARAAIEHIKQSDLPAKTRNLLSEAVSKIQEKFKAAFS